jgi:hypothetical protein
MNVNHTNLVSMLEQKYCQFNLDPSNPVIALKTGLQIERISTGSSASERLYHLCTSYSVKEWKFIPIVYIIDYNTVWKYVKHNRTTDSVRYAFFDIGQRCGFNVPSLRLFLLTIETLCSIHCKVSWLKFRVTWRKKYIIGQSLRYTCRTEIHMKDIGYIANGGSPRELEQNPYTPLLNPWNAFD